MCKDFQEDHNALNKQKALELIDRYSRFCGEVGAEEDGGLFLTLGNHSYSIETIEKWVKQAKAARKNKYV